MSRPISGSTFTAFKRQRQKNNDIYVFERTMRYNPKTRKTETLKTKLIGKILAGSEEMIPTRPKKAASSVKPSGRQHVGAMQILDFVGRESGIDSDLESCFDVGDSQKIVSIARYLVATEGQSLTRLENWTLNHPVPYVEGISEDVYYKLFGSLGNNEEGAQRYFARRARSLGQSPLIAYDSTTISTYSENQLEARRGFNKDRDGLDTIKLLTLYSVKDREPIAYTKQPGNIPDVISLENALKQLESLEPEKPLIVTDNGYYSQSNMAAMAKKSMKFITAVPATVKWVRKLIDEHRDGIDGIENMCPFDSGISGICVPTMQKLEFVRQRSRNGVKAGDTEAITRRLYVHIYLNKSNTGRDEIALRDGLAELKRELEDGQTEFKESAQAKIDTFLTLSRRGRGGKLHVGFNNEAYQEARRYYGFFALVSNEEKDPFKALANYRLREKIEELFAVQKSGLDARRPRTWYPDNLRGRLFVQFVALGYYCALQKRIKSIQETLAKPTPGKTKKELELESDLRKWLEKKSLVQILDWFDCIEQTTVETPRGKRRWSTETIARDRLFLEKLGMKTMS